MHTELSATCYTAPISVQKLHTMVLAFMDPVNCRGASYDKGITLDIANTEFGL